MSTVRRSNSKTTETINPVAAVCPDVSRESHGLPSVWEQYNRMLVFIAVAVALSALVMAIAAGATWEHATMIGAIGIVVGGATALYVYRLLVEIRQT